MRGGGPPGPPGPPGGGPPGPPSGGGPPPGGGPPGSPPGGCDGGALVPIGRGGRGRGLGGMAILGSSWEMALTIRLLALSPAVRTGPSLDPFKTPSSESRRSWARGRCAPWQRTHVAFKMGAMSLSNVTPVWVDAGGNLLQSTSAAESLAVARPAAARMIAVFIWNWFGWSRPEMCGNPPAKASLFIRRRWSRSFFPKRAVASPAVFCPPRHSRISLQTGG